MPLLSLYDGLLFIFDGYRPVWESFLEPTSVITAHFKAVSERVGVELLPPKQLVNSMGFRQREGFMQASSRGVFSGEAPFCGTGLPEASP